MFDHAFEAIGKAFTSWGPILESVKREYDGWCGHLTAENERLRVVESRMVSLEGDLAEKVRLRWLLCVGVSVSVSLKVNGENVV